MPKLPSKGNNRFNEYKIYYRVQRCRFLNSCRSQSGRQGDFFFEQLALQRMRQEPPLQHQTLQREHRFQQKILHIPLLLCVLIKAFYSGNKNFTARQPLKIALAKKLWLLVNRLLAQCVAGDFSRWIFKAVRHKFLSCAAKNRNPFPVFKTCPFLSPKRILVFFCKRKDVYAKLKHIVVLFSSK